MVLYLHLYLFSTICTKCEILLQLISNQFYTLNCTGTHNFFHLFNIIKKLLWIFVNHRPVEIIRIYLSEVPNSGYYYGTCGIDQVNIHLIILSGHVLIQHHESSPELSIRDLPIQRICQSCVTCWFLLLLQLLFLLRLDLLGGIFCKHIENNL